MTAYDAFTVLRLDGTPEDLQVVEGLLAAVPAYIENATGMKAEVQDNYPVVDTCTGFLLRLWYYPEGADTDKLQRVIDSLLKSITLIARTLEN